jgi:hypothetical protein
MTRRERLSSIALSGKYLIARSEVILSARKRLVQLEALTSWSGRPDTAETPVSRATSHYLPTPPPISNGATVRAILSQVFALGEKSAASSIKVVAHRVASGQIGTTFLEHCTACASPFFRRQFFALRLGEILELFRRHRFCHLLGSAFKTRFRTLSAFRRQSGAGCHLLFFGSGWHISVSLVDVASVGSRYQRRRGTMADET